MASIGSDTSDALLDQSVLSGDDGQHVNTTDHGSSTTTTPSASATAPESSTATTSLAGSSILPAMKRKRKQTKMEKPQRNVNATFDKTFEAAGTYQGVTSADHEGKHED